MIRRVRRIFLISLFFIMGICVYAQDGAHGAYSPYSIYGIGDLSKEGTAFTKSMGGVGIATRNRRFINYMNPAAVTARDTLSFMADFGLQQGNRIFRQGKLISANNTLNIYDFVMSFPIYKSSAFMIGITPFSDMGYDFSSVNTDKEVIGDVGNISGYHDGTGSVYQIFAGAGVTFWKRVSLGAELIYYFGNMDKVANEEFSNTSYRSPNTGNDLMIRGVTGKFGLQYEQKLGDDISLTIGATYRLGTNMKGYITNYEYATQSGVTDTLRYNIDTLARSGARFGDELGVGIAVKGGEKWTAEFNYIRSDWRNSGFDGIEGLAISGTSVFSSTVSQSFRAGFEFVPNRNDIRYYMKRCSYRAGIYYDQAYYKFDGNNINSMGITLGITLPVFRWYNGITLGVDIGQRASTRNPAMVRERYANFVIGFNIHDIWFRKVQYQ